MHPLIPSDLLISISKQMQGFLVVIFDVELFVTPIDLAVRVPKIATKYLGVAFLIVFHVCSRFVPFLKS